jgi:long-chain acyl-CoA synthetase
MTTILHRLADWAHSEPKTVAQRFLRNGEWVSITTREFCDRVYWLALFFESRGMKSSDVGTILAYNSPEWVHADLATLLLGAKSAGIYPNSTQKDIHYILEHTESRFFSVQNQAYFEKLTGTQAHSGLPDSVEMVLVFKGDPSFSSKAVSYETALAQGKKLAAQPGAKTLQQYLDALDPHAGAFMIYTSGTTGNPKGALLSHDNLVYTVDHGLEHWGLKPNEGRLFSFLPLCHIAEKIQNLGGGICLKYTVYFCSEFEKVASELPLAEPTLLLCVPRLWEKMMEGVNHKLNQAPPLRKALADWALNAGRKAAKAKYSGQSLSPLDQVQLLLAERLVLGKIKRALGLGKATVLASGAAVLPAHVTRWFHALGGEITEVFGQTESSGIIFMTERGKDQAGLAGGPVKGMECKLAEDGEILTRGRHVFKGYFKDADATAKTIDSEGWLHTGDLAELTASGVYRIRGRKKEIMKTSGGKIVAPLHIEEELKTAPMISQVCLVGDGKKFISALITLTEGKLAEISKMQGAFDGVVIRLPQVIDEVQSYVDRMNQNLAGYEQVKKFAILSKEFSIDRGEMTPTLKMKRNVIETRYQDIINSFYV